MRSIIILCIFCFAMTVVSSVSPSRAHAGFFTGSDATLVTIDGDAYTTEDYKSWWGNWRDRKMAVPDTPDSYIDWLLFAREGKQTMLYDDPQIQRDVMVYLKVLSLVQLKNEEIDSRIVFSDENLREYYDKTFVPEWTLNVAIYRDEESARQASDELKAGRVTIGDIEELAGRKSRQAQAQSTHGREVLDVDTLKGLTASGETLLGVQVRLKKRPYNIDKAWRAGLEALEPGGFSGPVPWQDSFVVLNLVDVFEGSGSDFEKKKSSVRQRYRKYREAVLTLDLIRRLKKKYKVVVNEDRLREIDFEASESGAGDDPVITVGELTVSGKQLAAKVRKDIALNRQYGFKSEGIGRLVQRIVDSIVSQTLISLESLDRHYERESPVRELFEFKKDNKLVMKLEKQIRDQVKGIEESELKEYYEKNRADYTRPAVYHMAVITDDDEEQLKKIWLEVVVNGRDVMAVTEERLGFVPAKQKYPENHLDPEIREIASQLAKGDLSRIFSANGTFNMIYMLNYTPARTKSFDAVRESIRHKILEEKFSRARQKYLDTLKAGTEIVVNETVWQNLRKELVRENEQQ